MRASIALLEEQARLERTRRQAVEPADRPDASQDRAVNFNYEPGSTFKAFVLTAAIKQGIDPDTTYYDGSSPANLEIPGGGNWEVNNAEPGGGTMPLNVATWDSVNVIFAKLGLTPPKNIIELAPTPG